LRLFAKPRLLLHAVDWCLPTSCSQVGGMHRSMTFLHEQAQARSPLQVDLIEVLTGMCTSFLLLVDIEPPHGCGKRPVPVIAAMRVCGRSPDRVCSPMQRVSSLVLLLELTTEYTASAHGCYWH
jgi:hypothetical protein